MSYRRYVIRRAKISQRYPGMPVVWLYRTIRGDWLTLNDPNLSLYTEGTTVCLKPEPGYIYEMIPVDVSTVRKVVRA